jgi:hypothetical protein
VSTATDLHRLAADLTGPWHRRAVDAAVEQLRKAVEAAARKAVGGDLALAGQRSRLGVRVATTSRGATLIATGPWALVERPRRGGYVIRPKQRGGAVRVASGPVWRASAVGGAITSPLKPWDRGTDDGRQPAVDSVAVLLGEVVARA